MRCGYHLSKHLQASLVVVLVIVVILVWSDECPRACATELAEASKDALLLSRDEEFPGALRFEGPGRAREFPRATSVGSHTADAEREVRGIKTERCIVGR